MNISTSIVTNELRHHQAMNVALLLSTGTGVIASLVEFKKQMAERSQAL